jgi:bacterioferritin-associated ferredoxin
MPWCLYAYTALMNEDDHVCLCFHVSKRKIISFIRREKPAKASQISECLSAGTGCGWCIPFLKKLHAQVMDGERKPDVSVKPDEYAAKRAEYRQKGEKNEF